MSEAPKAFITGASSGIGAETARVLTGRGWEVAIGAREKVKRINKLADELNDMGGNAHVVMGDITDSKDRKIIVDDVSDWSPEIDALVLNAAGGLEPWIKVQGMEPREYAQLINNESQVALAEGFVPVLTENGAIVYVTSHWSHVYDKVKMPPFEDYDIVASTKFAGESSLRRELLDKAATEPERMARLIVVTGGIVLGTSVGTMAERRYPEFTAQQAAYGNVVELNEMASRVAEAASNTELPSGTTLVVGADLDTFLKNEKLEEEV
jgi:NADP-dependent 3-hydroxy acid dehydrogenase YdfG